jgi:transcriptional regulator with XRE-family HTH domain
LARGRFLVPTVPHLKTIRTARLLTQRMLAQRSGVSRPTIARLERGDEPARPPTIWKLADALDVEPSVLIGVEMILTLREQSCPPHS